MRSDGENNRRFEGGGSREIEKIGEKLEAEETTSEAAF